MPHSLDREYSERAIPQYERAVELGRGQPVRIPFEGPSHAIEKIVASCDGVLLPGSKADIAPAKFKSDRSPHTAPADPLRDSIDEFLLRDAYNLRKPVLGICYGLQSLNVFRGGSLIQHIPDFLPEALRSRVNHEAGRNIPIAHTVSIEPNSELFQIVEGKNREGHGFSRANGDSLQEVALATEGGLLLSVNSSHHQSGNAIGNDLRIVARCPDDAIIEALEGTDPDHFVLAVQWHPERSVDLDQPSRNIFRALVEAAVLTRK
jgi:putative glutamine amidotransferase